MAVYLLFGDEPYILDAKLKELVTEAFKGQEEMKEFNIDNITSEDVYAKYNTALETLPFMSDRRVVIFKRCDLLKQKPNKKEEEVIEYLENYVKQKVEDTTVIILEGEKVDKRKKLYKTIVSHGEIVEGKKLNVYDIKKWIADKIKDNGKTISPKILDYLSNNLPNDMYLLENELDKLLAYIDHKPNIEEDDLGICSFSVMENIFKLIDSIIYKRLDSALTILKGMLHDGEPPMVILFMIIKQIRNIAKAKSVKDKGYTTKQIGEMTGVTNPYALSQVLKQCDQFTIRSVQKSLELVAEYEIKIKTGQLDYHKGLELLITNLSFL